MEDEEDYVWPLARVVPGGEGRPFCVEAPTPFLSDPGDAQMRSRPLVPGGQAGGDTLCDGLSSSLAEDWISSWWPVSSHSAGDFGAGTPWFVTTKVA